MSVKKQFLKSKPVCKVTWKVAKKEIGNAEKVNLVGSFNNWNESETEFTKLKNGDYKLTLTLESGMNYEFRYLANGERWFDEPTADAFMDNKFSNEQNSVLEL